MKENFRPVSILPTLSKIFEKCLFAKYLLYSTQHCLLVMLETWKRSVDKGKVFGALLRDLSKAFDCLDHELLTAKLNAYGFSLPALRLINDYLSNRKQRTKIENTYSTWLDIIFGVPQGSILGPLLFNVFLADLFFTVNDIDTASYVDDNTPYMIADNVDDLITSLEQASNGLFEWFKNNLLKSNAGKCHLLVSTNDRVSMNVDGFKIDKSDTEKLLSVKFDKKLTFNHHISDICKKVSRKISALAWVTSYVGITKKRILMNTFFTSKFSYCPLVWMCHSRTNNSKINRLHERCLRIVYNDKQSLFNELLEKDGSVSIRMRNIQISATEMYILINNLL